MTRQASTPQPVAPPPNHDGMNLADLPPVSEAFLDPRQISALLDDIQQHGSQVQLMQRRKSSQLGQRDHEGQIAWEAVKRAFLDGTVSRLQIRYHWRTSQWIDTLEHRDGVVRLVRVQHARNPLDNAT